ncbi:MAG: T9SS type A sorting domain-containing protein [Paludibacteraceae bacterium]|nr:T9SS type A sorting domain-containing protein [Paludibacteraceae bacterium]
MKKILYILCSAAMALLMAMPTWAAEPEPDQFTIVNHRLCEGDSLLIRDGWKKIKETTVFWDTLKSTVTGEDSIIKHIVNTLPTYRHIEEKTIKDGETYTWNGQSYNQQGEYTYSLKTVEGCDSICILRLFVTPVDVTYQPTMYFCDGDSLIINGHIFKQPGVYRDTIKSIQGRDSILVYPINKYPTYTLHQTLSFCQGGTIEINGHVFTQPGEYRDTLNAIYGCDSILIYHINTYPTFHQYDTIVITDQDQRIWHGQQITESKTYYDSYTDIHGCDSVYQLYAIVLPTYRYVLDTTICQNALPFLWRGQEISAEGTYTQKYESIYHTDSIYILNLTVHPTYWNVQNVYFCEGGEVTFGGKTYTQSCRDTIRYGSSLGCDSVIEVVVNERRAWIQSDTVRMSNQETKLWRGQTITTSGIYYDRYNSVDGCDSIFELVVFVYPTFLFEEQATICQSEAPYIWHGMECSRLGTHTYEQVFKTIYGLDSIYRLTLTIGQEYEQTLQFNVCEGSYIEFEGNQCVSPGQYDFTLKTIHGCDSVIHVIVNSVSSYLFSDTAYINDYTPYTWPITGETYSEAGVYSLPGSTTNGCDSSYQLIIYKYPKYIMPVEHIELCMRDTDSFMWRGNEYNQTGVYYDSLFTVHGQDSIYTLNLVIHPIYDTIINATVCPNTTYTMNGKPYTESGIYKDTLVTIDGCDSIFTLNLIVLPRINEVRFDTICETVLPYTFYDQQIWTEGTYSYQFPEDQEGCNGTVTLHLSVRPDLNHNDSIIICHQDVPYILGDTSGERGGIKLYNDTVVYSCDSLYHFRLHVRDVKDSVVTMCDNDSLWLAGVQRWIHPIKGEVYYDTILYAPSTYSEYDVKVQCDSVVRYVIEGTYPSFNQDTIVRHINEQDSLFWAGQYRKSEGFYYDTLQTAACHCDSIITLHLIVDPIYVYWDSIHICQPHDIAYRHIWADGHEQNADIWQPGTYIDSLRSIRTRDLYNDYDRDYRDSIYVLVVTMDPSYFFNSVYQLCQGDSVQFGSQWIYEAGVYTDSMKTYLGCDSIYQMVVNMTPSYYIREQKGFVQGTIYEWHGQSFSIPGIYYDSLKAINGCDSIYQLTLTVYPTYNFQTEYVTICATEAPYYWEHGHENYSATGTYTKRFATVAGYDSIYTLDLTVLPVSRGDYYANICDGDSVIINNIVYKNGGLFYDTLKATNGCDSIVAIHIARNSKYFFAEQQQTSDQTPFVWEGHGKQFTQSGVYYDSLKTVNGCDSVYQLTLTVYPTYNFQTEYVTICATEAPYYWENGHENYSATGTYTKRFETVAGYDSIYTLDLTVLPVSRGDYYANICDGDSVTINNIVYKNGGLFYDTLKAANGCDSIVAIHIARNSKYFFAEQQQTNDQTPFVWEGHGKQFTQSGVYYDSLKTVNGCDSIYQLTLTVYPTYNFQTEYVTICATEAPYYWENGHENYSATGTYTKRFETVAGYDSIYTLDLTVLPVSRSDYYANICDGDSVIINNIVYKNGGLFYDTLKATNGCDSIVTIHVTMSTKYFYHETVSISESELPYTWIGHPDVEIPYAGTFYDYQHTMDGCDSIFEIVVTAYKEFDYSITVCENELPYMLAPNKPLMNSGIYVDTLRNVAGQDSLIRRCKLIVYPVVHTERTVMLCQGSTYTLYNGRVVSEGGNYNDTLQSAVSGCDSIITIHLSIAPTFDIKQEATIYEGDSVLFEGEWLKESGLYRKSYTSIFGCDSTVQLNLTVRPIYYLDTTVYVCDYELPYVWNGESFYDAGDYTRAKESLVDKVFATLHLIVGASYYEQRTIDICQGDTIAYRNKLYYTSGVFYDTIPTTAGCDSIFQITVRVMKTYYNYLTVNISDKETYVLGEGERARILNKEGTYFNYDKTAEGCDSITELTLHVHPSYFFQEDIDICQNELPYDFHGRQIWETGVYYDSLLTKQGYDSVYMLNCIVHPTYLIEEAHDICPDRTTYIHGLNISQPGVYYDSLTTHHGCDSVYKIVVNWRRTYEQEYSAEICQGEAYDFYGVSYTRTGTYKYKIGCDSIITLHLVVHESKMAVFNELVCPEDMPFFFHGKEYEQAGVYCDTFKTSFGCDSIVKLNLNVSTKCSQWNRVPLCKDDTIFILGDTLYKAGEYQFKSRSSSGLVDSIYRIELYNAPVYERNVVDSMCQGDTMWVGDQPITRSGLHHIYLKTTEGCDSIIHLNLTVFPSYLDRTNATIADYQTYNWRGVDYNVTGIYDYVLPTIHNCDSTFRLDLYVVPTQRPTSDVAICSGSTYTWRGRVLSEPGTYTDTILNLASYTSVIYTLNLTVEMPTQIVSARLVQDEVCADDDEVQISFIYNGAKPSNYSILFDSRALKEGFTNIHNQPFGEDMLAKIPLPKRTDPAYLEHANYIRPDMYYLRMVLESQVCGNSQSDTLSFMVRYPSWLLEQNWSDVVALLSSTYNGGYQFSQYDWYVNGVRITNAGNSYLYSKDLRPGDQVYVSATREGENYSITSCPITIVKPEADKYPHPILVYPSSAPKKMPCVTIQSTEDGQFDVFSQTGQAIQHGTVVAGEQIVTMPAVSGCYILKAATKNGQSTTQKIIIF